MIKVVVCGALGRMGTTVGRLANEAPDLALVGGIDLRGGSFFGVDVTEAAQIDTLLASARPDVLIDFTAPAASVSHVRAAAKSRTAVVVGTTGISAEQRAEMEEAIQGTIPAVISSNFSIGVNIFWKLLREAARMLPEYDVEVSRLITGTRRMPRAGRQRPFFRSLTMSSVRGRRSTGGKG